MINYALETIEKVKFCICPECGDRVFIPLEGWQKEYGGTSEDPIVFCHDMGHWVGHLSNCEIKGKMAFIAGASQ